MTRTIEFGPAWSASLRRGPEAELRGWVDSALQWCVETDAIGFFAETALPELSLTRVVPSQIALAFEHLRNPERPTDFD